MKMKDKDHIWLLANPLSDTIKIRSWILFLIRWKTFPPGFYRTKLFLKYWIKWRHFQIQRDKVILSIITLINIRQFSGKRKSEPRKMASISKDKKGKGPG